MTSVVELYEQLASAPDEKTRARLIAEAFERMEERYPEVRELATQSGVRESELRLQKEIEQVRADLTERIEQVRADLTERIEQLRAELTERVEQLRADLTTRIEEVRFSILRWVVGLLAAQTLVILAAFFAIAR